MGRRSNRAKGNAKRAAPRKAQKPADARVRDLEKRFAEAVGQLETRDRELAEAQEQLTATSEILRVISSSPTDYQPVFDTIVRRAGVVCGAVDAILWTVDGDELVVRAHHGPIPATIGARQPMEGSVAGGAACEARIIHVEDLTQADEFPVGREIARRVGWRTTLSAPLLRGDVAIGALLIRRSEVRPFSEKQIALLQTFADEAVIAIENVRLFTERESRNRDLIAALDQQTATSEILRVISSSVTDVQPVFDAIVRSAVRLCGASHGGVYRFDGELVHSVANEGFSGEQLAQWRKTWPRPASADTSLVCEAIRTRGVVRIGDIEATTSVRLTTETRANLRARGSRSVLAVPMISHDAVVGAIGLAHPGVDGFSDAHVELLRTFADQAVIAIENVRLVTELQGSNRQLTEALDQQTATSEILRVIASSPTDVQPVFDAIAEAAMRLCGGQSCLVTTFDGERLHLVAQADISSEGREVVRGVYPRRPTRGFASGRAVLTRAMVEIPDLTTDQEYDIQVSHIVASVRDFRSILAVPMLRDGLPMGTINAHKAEPGPFPDQQIALLQTFADQAVIAIENVRLFEELQASNKHLTNALDKQTATSDILRAISRSQTDVQPVFEAILSSAVGLLGAYAGVLTRVVDNQIELAAFSRTDDAGAAALRAAFPQSLQSGLPHAQAIRDRAPLNIADAQTDPRLPEAERVRAGVRGYRSRVLVPLLRQDEAIGAISVARREPGGFNADEISLLRTFADQAVIAIENARLLTALQARTDDLTRSVEQLTALGDVGRAVSSTLDLETVLSTIVSRAVELSGLDGGVVFEYDEAAEEFVHRVATEVGGALAEARRSTRVRKGEGVVGQTALTLEPAQVVDITVPGAYESRLRENLIASGVRAVLAVPMVREGELIGCLVVSRNRPGEFTADTIELLRTFATQSALAIQNARLFREIELKSRELEAASRHKSEFLANMSHELRTPLNAIIGFSEVLSERLFGELNAKQDEYLKDIHASGQHLLSLINDILDLSKIEAGKMELELSNFDLPTTIDNALILVRERAARRGIALHRTVDERLGQIRADERKVRQVLLNLLSNAIKFTPEGGRIEVGAQAVNGSIEVSVTDTGVGIAPEDQEAVFEEFRQVGSAEKKVEGTGLGLALSRKFIELHGGRIWVKSPEGHGATFTFTIPVHPLETRG